MVCCSRCCNVWHWADGGQADVVLVMVVVVMCLGAELMPSDAIGNPHHVYWTRQRARVYIASLDADTVRARNELNELRDGGVVPLGVLLATQCTGVCVRVCVCAWLVAVACS